MISPLITAFLAGGSTATGMLLLIAGHVPQGVAGIIFGIGCAARAWFDQKRIAAQ